MTERNQHLYRCRAEYDDPQYNTTRHFQTLRAARQWAKNRLAGYPGVDDMFGPVKEPIPPAEQVHIDRSNPITWP